MRDAANVATKGLRRFTFQSEISSSHVPKIFSHSYQQGLDALVGATESLDAEVLMLLTTASSQRGNIEDSS